MSNRIKPGHIEGETYGEAMRRYGEWFEDAGFEIKGLDDGELVPYDGGLILVEIPRGNTPKAVEAIEMSREFGLSISMVQEGFVMYPSEMAGDARS